MPNFEKLAIADKVIENFLRSGYSQEELMNKASCESGLSKSMVSWILL